MTRPDLTPRDLVGRTKAFIRDHVLVVDDQNHGDVERAGGDRLRVQLQALARDAGLLSLHAPPEYGGLGLSMLERAPVFEEAGYSLFGPMALNINAPDEGNVHLLSQIASEEQRERFLGPLARGEVRSAFAMTEPAPGAGSDPRALSTWASRASGGWRINGDKHFITGADGATFYIVIARTDGHAGDASGATMFLVDAATPGVEVVRHIETIDRSMIGGHCEVRFRDVAVTDDDVLGDVGRGFERAQIRLGPARMTHVMRWTGAARRAHEVAVAHAAGREAFGARLSDLGMVQQLIADNEIDLAATRALLRVACDELDGGSPASKSTSIAKTFAAEALDRVVDRATQMCGGLGVSFDLPIARIAREIRPFRIYDGPSEVHRWSIARRAIREVGGATA